MISILEVIVGKLVALLIGWLWRHHEGAMTDATNQRQTLQAHQITEAGHAKADETLVQGVGVAATVGSDGLRAGSEALNNEIESGD